MWQRSLSSTTIMHRLQEIFVVQLSWIRICRPSHNLDSRLLFPLLGWVNSIRLIMMTLILTIISSNSGDYLREATASRRKSKRIRAITRTTRRWRMIRRIITCKHYSLHENKSANNRKQRRPRTKSRSRSRLRPQEQLALMSLTHSLSATRSWKRLAEVHSAQCSKL